MATVALVDPLDHFLAALVFEIDVDIGRFVALSRDEALEQQVVAARVDRGDAEQETHCRVGRRASALAEDSLAPREPDDAVDGQEIGRVSKPCDQVEFVLQRLSDALRQAFRIALGRALPRSLRQGLLSAEAFDADLMRILIGQLLQVEPAAVGDLARARHRLGPEPEETRHLGGRLQVTVGEPLAIEPDIIDRHALAHTGDDILQLTPLADMEQNIVGGHGRYAGAGRHAAERVEPQQIAGPAPQRERAVGPVPEHIGEPAQA